MILPQVCRFVMEWPLFCLHSLSSLFCWMLLFPDLISPILSRLNRSPFIGLIWSPINWEIGSGAIFSLALAFFHKIIVTTKRSGTFPPWQWWSQSLNVQDGGCRILFIAPRINGFNFCASSRPWSERWSWNRMKKQMLCLMTWTFWMGFNWQVCSRSNFIFQSSRGRDILPSWCMYMPKYFCSFSKSREGIGIPPHLFLVCVFPTRLFCDCSFCLLFIDLFINFFTSIPSWFDPTRSTLYNFKLFLFVSLTVSSLHSNSW